MGCFNSKDLQNSVKPASEIKKAEPIHIGLIKNDPNIDIEARKGIPYDSKFQSTARINCNVRSNVKPKPNPNPNTKPNTNPTLTVDNKNKKVWWTEDAV